MSIHSCSFWPAYFSHWLCFTSAAAFLPPTSQPEMRSLAYLQSMLSSSLPVSDSCLHTASYTQPAFPASPIQLFQVLLWEMEGMHREGAAGMSFVRMLGKKFCPCHAHQYCLISISSPDIAGLQETLSVWCCMTLQSDLCVAPVQWFLARGCSQPPAIHDVSWHRFINKEPRARVAATQFRPDF